MTCCECSCRLFVCMCITTSSILCYIFLCLHFYHFPIQFQSHFIIDFASTQVKCYSATIYIYILAVCLVWLFMSMYCDWNFNYCEAVLPLGSKVVLTRMRIQIYNAHAAWVGAEQIEQRRGSRTTRCKASMALSAAEEFPREVAARDSSPPPFHIASLLSTSPAAEQKRRGANHHVSNGSPPSDWPLTYASTGEFTAAEYTIERCILS